MNEYFGLILVLVALLCYLKGPSIRQNAPQIPFETMSELNSKGTLWLAIENKPLAREIVLCDRFPKSKYSSYITRLRILRFLYFISFSSFWFFSQLEFDGDNGGLALFVVCGLIGSLLFRHYANNRLSNDVAEEAIKDKSLYDLVSTLGAWRYYGSSAYSVVAELQDREVSKEEKD